MATPFSGDDSDRVTVRFAAVLLSTVGVWACYFALVTLRTYVVEDSGHLEMMGRRAIVTASGIAVTLLLWLILRQLEARALAIRIAATLILSLPAALGIAWVNHLAFEDMDKSYSILDDGRTRIAHDAQGNFVIAVPGAPRVVVQDPMSDGPEALWKELTDIAVARYFLLIAWGALFLALQYAERVRAAERREAELRRTAKAAELRSLRYQVNPHFLFNTLNSLSALVLTKKTAAAEAMIQSLATFYRTSLTGDATADMPLADEVRLQQLYLDVEAVRFPDRLKVEIDLPEGLASACVPGLILQPLVENAVKHGVAATTRPVTIRVSARTEGGLLHLTVADDGPGHSDTGGGHGIGLRNVRERLAARFGAAGSMTVAQDNGFAVTLGLPLTVDGC